MAWIVVPNLLELRDQINAIAPNRDKASDGFIGDYAHSQGLSSHNPDDTPQHNAEWDGDSDSLQEVRAFDIDVDFNVPWLSAQKLVDHLVKYAKNGTFWWLEYVIYNRRIWSSGSNWEPRTYNGSSPHTEHIHVNSGYDQASDLVKNVNYRLEELLPEDKMAVTDVADYFDNVRQAIDNDGPDATDRDWRNDVSKVIRFGLGYNANEQTLDKLPPKRFDNIERALSNLALAVAAIPSAEMNAEAVVEALGGADVGTIADTLRSALSADKLAELKAAL